jgi:hypothetical protein
MLHINLNLLEALGIELNCSENNSILGSASIFPDLMILLG